jgi:GrpB-like predicted nucleotidyltransferase (UPF0157 family)
VKGSEKTLIAKPISIAKYDPRWPIFFREEAAKIRSFMGKDCVDIHHVGSTSVPGLAAKPIIDMVLVTGDLERAQMHLIGRNLGYRYKGEYNLPLSDLYEKKNECKIYLHVHEVGSSEIALNLMFRDFLRSHRDICKQYESVKIKCSQSSEAGKKVETGITRYNLMKHAIIVKILGKIDVKDLCVRFAAQDEEHEAFERFRLEFCGDIRTLPAETKKFILCQGVEIVGAAALSSMEFAKFSIDFAAAKTGDGFTKLLDVMETWARRRKHAHSLTATAIEAQRGCYVAAGFAPLANGRDGKITFAKNF